MAASFSLLPKNLTLLEARNARGEQLDLERVRELLLASAELPMDALIERVYRAVTQHAEELDDDVTLLAFRYLGPAAYA